MPGLLASTHVIYSLLSTNHTIIQSFNAGSLLSAARARDKVKPYVLKIAVVHVQVCSWLLYRSAYDNKRQCFGHIYSRPEPDVILFKAAPDIHIFLAPLQVLFSLV